MYPEISTLSAVDITNDLDFLVQNRRIMGTPAAPGAYEVQQQQHQQHQIQQQQHYGPQQQQQQLYNSHQQQPIPQRNGAVMGSMSGGVGRTVNNVGMGLSNGVLPPQVQAQQQQASQMGPPPPMMHPLPHPHQPPPQQHPVGVGFEHQYIGDIPPFGPPGVGGRMREPQPTSMNSYQQQQQHSLPPPGHLPPPQPTTTKSRDPSYPAYSGGPGPGPGCRIHPSSHGPPLPVPGNSAHSHSHGYSKDHEKAGPTGPGPNGPGGGGHHHHTYFGQGGSGVGVDGAYGPPSSSSHMPGNGMNGRRSISPVHVMSNGNSGGGGGKPNGMWMSGYHHGNGSGKGGGAGEWGDARMMHEDEMVREREREREREKDRDRDREIDRRYRDRDRDREHQEFERERQWDHQHIQQQHRQPPQPPDREHQEFERERQRDHQHIQQQHRQPPPYGGSSAPPPQGPGIVPQHHHHVAPSHHHHHHRPPPHHHHVVHHHHSSTSLPPGGVGSAPIVHSPRSSRDYDSSRPPQLHPGPGQPHSSEVILLPSGNKPSSQPQLHPREREREPWSGKSPDEQHHNPPSSAHEYRERERDHLIREMDNRKMHSRKPSSGPPMLPLEERDRPMPMPFAMPPSHNIQPASAPNSHLGSSNVPGSGTSPRGAPPSWPAPSSYDDTHRIPSTSSAPGYLNSPHPHDAVRSPIQGHRYAPSTSTGSGMGRHITTGSSSSSGLHHMISTPPPSRARPPPPSPSYSNPLSKSHLSPVAR